MLFMAFKLKPMPKQPCILFLWVQCHPLVSILWVCLAHIHQRKHLMLRHSTLDFITCLLLNHRTTAASEATNRVLVPMESFRTMEDILACRLLAQLQQALLLLARRRLPRHPPPRLLLALQLPVRHQQARRPRVLQLFMTTIIMITTATIIIATMDSTTLRQVLIRRAPTRRALTKPTLT